MKKSDLKELIRPIVKECVEESIAEVVLTSGILSQVISEVLKGVQPVIVEQKQEQTSEYAEILKRSEKSKISESRKQLLDNIGKTSYGGINVFEGIEDTIPDETSATNHANPMSGISPQDPGVDITHLFDFNKAKILAQGKKRQK